jgi:hypothetical protein
VDCKLVHGDRWQEIKGAMTQHIYGQKASTYDGEFYETYNSGVTRIMNGAVEEDYSGLVDRTYSLHVEELYMAGHQQQNYVEELEIRCWKAEVVENVSFETGPCKIDMVGLDLSVAGTAIDIAAVLQLELAPLGICVRPVLELGTAGFKLEYVGGNNEAKALESKLQLLRCAVGILDDDGHALKLTRLVLGSGFLAPA